MYKNFEKKVKQEIEKNNIPAISIGVIKDGKVDYLKSFGFIDQEKLNKVDQNTIFRIASCVKPITAVLIMQLIEKQFFKLDDKVVDIVKNFKPISPLMKLVTVKMLLNHTAGFPDGGDIDSPETTIKEEVESKIKYFTPLSYPGLVPGYSNYHFVLLGYIVENILKKDFEKVVEEYIFTPLEMENSTFDPEVARGSNRLALSFYKKKGELKLTPSILKNRAHNPSFFGFSTISDILKFLKMLLNNGTYKEKKLLLENSVKNMLKKQNNYYMLSGLVDGLGLGVGKYGNLDIATHSGRVVGYESIITIVPKLNLGIAIFINSYGVNIEDLSKDIIDLYVDENFDFDQPILNKNSYNMEYIEQFIGNYFGLTSGYSELFIEDNLLKIELNGEIFDLFSYNKEIYYAEEDGEEILSIGLLKDPEGENVITVDGAISKKTDIILENLPSNFSNYEGVYNHNGVQFIEIKEIEQNLFLIEDDMEYELFFIKKELFFNIDYGVIRFIFKDNKATSFYQVEGWFYKKNSF